MITVGLDFGTHQTKACVETREGVELDYTFFKFEDMHGKMQYTIPSIIQITNEGRLNYGYVHRDKNSKIIRYFKQAAFTSVNNGITREEAILFSIWYIAFILFDLEDKYGQNFAIQMGVPTDSARFASQKQLAVRLLLSAYHLVEDIFNNDKDAFLQLSYDELKERTELLDYSKEEKDEYSILVFPEAYACLMPLISSSKIATGMSLMVDIGGGTTDISFFLIKEGKPQVFDFKSLNKGLNFLTNFEVSLTDKLDSNIKDASEIEDGKKNIFQSEIRSYCVHLIERLKGEFKKQCSLDVHRLTDALNIRPIIYTGGGSTFDLLRNHYLGFKDVTYISEKEWNTKSISNLLIIKELGLCPILSTAYGLSISVTDDNIECEPFHDVFKSIRGLEEDMRKSRTPSYGTAIYSDGFNYEDYDAYK